MYSNYEENYKKMKNLRAEFDQDNVHNAMYHVVQNEAHMKGINEKKLKELEKLFGTLWETMKLIGDSYLATASLYPKVIADKFISSFENVCTLLNDFKGKGDAYSNFIAKIDSPEESDLLKAYDRLFTAWTPIASRTVTENVKKVKLELAEDARRRIEDVTEKLGDEFSAKKTDMEELYKDGQLAIDIALKEANVSGTKKALTNLVESVKKKKKNSVWVIAGLGAGLLITAGLSYCANKAIFTVAKAFDEKLRLFYVLKSSLPFFAIISVLSYFIITQYKLIKSYLHLIETYEFKSSLIDNMLGIVSGKHFSEGQKVIILTKLMDSIISFNSSGILDTKQENKDDIQNLMVQMMGMVSKSQSQ